IETETERLQRETRVQAARAETRELKVRKKLDSLLIRKSSKTGTTATSSDNENKHRGAVGGTGSSDDGGRGRKRSGLKRRASSLREASRRDEIVEPKTMDPEGLGNSYRPENAPPSSPRGLQQSPGYRERSAGYAHST
ncbi:unnamed protein product, partial [Amoebophrya sp. A25]